MIPLGSRKATGSSTGSNWISESSVLKFTVSSCENKFILFIVVIKIATIVYMRQPSFNAFTLRALTKLATQPERCKSGGKPMRTNSSITFISFGHLKILCVTPSLPRRSGTSKYRSDQAANTAKEYYGCPYSLCTLWTWNSTYRKCFILQNEND